MSITDRIGCPRVRVDRAHAVTATRALIAQARRETGSLAEDLIPLEEDAEPASMQSEDSQSTARRLRETLAALDAIGWPHEQALMSEGRGKHA